MNKLRILVVDDDPAIAEMLARALSRHGYEVESLHSASLARERFALQPCDAAVLDLVMPDSDGMELAQALRVLAPGLPIAILTGYMHSPLLAEARRPGMAVFRKPIAVQDVIAFLANELGRSSV